MQNLQQMHLFQHGISISEGLAQQQLSVRHVTAD